MSKQEVILTLVFLIFIGALTGAYFIYVSTQNDDAISVNNYSPKSTADTKVQDSKTEQVGSGSQLQVQGASTSNSQNQNSLPNPKQFSVYEKYANDQTASYIDIVVGKGETAETGDKVAMVYKGWLTNGELFDQSTKNDKGQIDPFVLELGAGQVIAGWEQTILGMKQGGKRRLVVPFAAGYGDAGQGPIPAKAMLIFDVELVQIQKKDLNPPGTILP